MGLGKTFQIISLILHDICENKNNNLENNNESMATIIICPLSVMSNWESQIENHIKENRLKI